MHKQSNYVYPEEETIRYYIVYMDIVGSSDGQLDLEEQIDKMNEFNKILNRILLPDNITENGSPPWKMGYYGSTGDGAVICFKLVRDPFRLVIWLLRDISEFNKNLPDLSIQLRVGISGGETLSLTRFDNTKAPWGRDMVIAKRIMDMANPGQILVSEGTKEQVVQFQREYKFKHMDAHIVKHGERVNVYSFTFEDSQGNKFGNDRPILCECHPQLKNESALVKEVKEVKENIIIKFKEFKDIRFRILYVLFHAGYVRGKDPEVLSDLQFIDPTTLQAEEEFLIKGGYIRAENDILKIENKGINVVIKIVEGFTNYLLSQQDERCKVDAQHIKSTQGERSPEFHRIRNQWNDLFRKFLSEHEYLE